MKKIFVFILCLSTLSIYSQCTSGISLSFNLLDNIPDFDVEGYHFTITNELNEVMWEYEDYSVTTNKHFEIQLPIGNYKLNWLNGGAQIYNPILQIEYGKTQDWITDSIQEQNTNYWYHFIKMPFVINEAYNNCNDTLVINTLESDTSSLLDSEIYIENEDYTQSELISDTIIEDEGTNNSEELRFSINNEKNIIFNKDLDYIVLSDINGRILKYIKGYNANIEIQIETIQKNTILFFKTIENKKIDYFKLLIDN